MRGSVIKRPGSKSWTIVYRAPDPATGKVKQTWKGGFSTRRIAELALKEIVGQIDEGTFTKPTTLTVREFVEETWLPGIEAGNFRPTTIDMYRRSVNRHVMPVMGATRLREVRPAALKGWLDGLKAGGVGDRTVAIAHVTMHKLLKSAVDLELLSRNPADNAAVRGAVPKSKAKEPIVWTQEQTKRFLESQRPDRMFAFWRLATMSGLRRAELAGLRWSDLDLDSASLRISSTRVVVGYKVVEGAPKTDKSRRTIGLDDATVTALRGHWAAQAAEKLKAGGEVYADGGYVFADELGEPYHPQRFTQMLAAKAKASGLPVVKLHALRHGHATAALEAGVPMKVVQERLGHSSMATTAGIYSHVSAAVDQAAAAQIAASVDAS